MDTELEHTFSLRILVPDAGLHRGTRDCEAEGCKKTTREGKPFCSRHIEQAPYVQELLAQLDVRAAEERLLEAADALIPRDGFFVSESVLLLRTRDFTVKSFSRRLDISHRATERLIDLLVEWGLARRVRTARGGNTVAGVGVKDLVDGI